MEVTCLTLIEIIVLFLSSAFVPRYVIGSLQYEISEELPVNTIVGNVKRDFSVRSGHTERTLSALRYNFRNQSDHFEIDSTSGIIRIKSIIDREELLCRMEDTCTINAYVIIKPNQFYDIVAVVFVIVDVNDNAPQFPSTTYSLEILETTTVGLAFLLPSADDLDGEEFGVKSYLMEGDQDKFGLHFSKHTDELRLRLLGALDREEVPGYSIRIIAQDGGNPPKSATLDLTIVVKDANDNPPRLLTENYEATLEEDIPQGTRILQVLAVDPDEGINGNLTYSFTDDTVLHYGRIFGILDDGWIFLEGVIDYERHRSLILTVVVADQGVMALTAYARVAIYVSDVNDNDPVITINNIQGRRSAEVTENMAAGSFVSHIVVTDADGGANGKVTCDIDNSRFRLVSLSDGNSEYRLVNTEVFDREEHPQETFTISCRDRGSPARSSSLKVTVWIVDENDNSPQFKDEKIAVRMRENNANGTLMAIFNATDRDEGANAQLDFRVEAVGNTPPGAVVVNQGGEVRAAISFDYEDRQEYEYRVVASDRGSPSRSSYALLEVRIEDVNDEYPIFEVASYVFRTAENLPTGTVVGKVRAWDDDRTPGNRNIHYSFVDANPYLSINPVTGEIIVAKVLDREGESSIKVRVRASNGLDFSTPGVMNSEVNVKVYVEDENDNSPVIVFPNSLNNTLILPRLNELQSGESVSKVEAFDPDEGPNANLTFSIDGASEAGRYFRMEASTGWIKIADTLDRNKLVINLDGVQLVVRVTDHGSPPRSTTEVLNVLTANWAQVSVESHNFDLLEGGSMVIIVGVGCGVLVVAVVVAVAVVCFRFHRCKNKHKYNCRLEAHRATSSGSLNKYGNRKDSTDGTKTVEHGDAFATRALRGTEKKGVRFNLDHDHGPSISSPITDCKLSCPFPDECAFHRNDTLPSKSSPNESPHEPLYSFLGDRSILANGNFYSPCPESSIHHQRLPQQPIVIPILQQRSGTLRKVDIPRIDHILLNGKADQAGPAWNPSYPIRVRTSSMAERWSNGSLPDSGQGPSDEDDPVFYPGSQEPFFPAESKV